MMDEQLSEFLRVNSLFCSDRNITLDYLIELLMRDYITHNPDMTKDETIEGFIIRYHLEDSDKTDVLYTLYDVLINE